jgi:hypothetical protein
MSHADERAACDDNDRVIQDIKPGRPTARSTALREAASLLDRLSARERKLLLVPEPHKCAWRDELLAGRDALRLHLDAALAIADDIARELDGNDGALARQLRKELDLVLKRLPTYEKKLARFNHAIVHTSMHHSAA